ncbi:MAG: SUMF1/EgtB/PvdO family nonheme iron enzyme [Prevotella sp.]|nr:SUMF1/EgtB/PvdO family nonheme iron enzyme [Prevotella sp.]
MTYRTYISFILFLFSLLPFNVNAQELAVADFTLDESDLTANLDGTTVLDQNGEKCALIKIFTTATDFTFDVGSLGVADMKQKPGEIWLYVPHGVRRITINHSQLGICEYTFNIPINKARTYKMKLVAGQVQTIVRQAVTSQYVVFNVTPPSATVEINNQMLDVVDGGTSVRLPFGSYDYTVRAPRYAPSVGKIQVNDPKNKHRVQVSLEPAFSTVSMLVDADAEIWINDQKRGVRSFRGELSYGTYLVECRQQGHRPSQKEITLTKENAGQTFTLPKPTPMYGSVDVNTTPIDCDIYIDNVKVGTSPMLVEQCLVGTHTLSITKQGYSTFSRTVTVSEGQTETVNTRLENGCEVAIAAPPGAVIFVDGEPVGNTQYVGNLTNGHHTAYAVLNGKRGAAKQIDVAANTHKVSVQLSVSDDKTFTTETVNTRLENCCEVAIAAPPGAVIFVDGKLVGNTQYVGNLTYGHHTAYAVLNGKRGAEKTIDIAMGNTQKVSVQLSVSDDKTFTIGGVTFEMVAVDGGTFKMGGTSEQGRNVYSDEIPTHLVTLSSYLIGKTEVTQALWQAVMGSNPSSFKVSNRPVESVSWKDCQDFIKKLNKMTGKQFRLPTEAEWEYAARGGSKSRGYKYSGGNSLENVAWYSSNSIDSTHDVATKQPNELGIYDMSGNVWEWCCDRYGPYSSSHQTNPQGAPSGQKRVYRGGGWDRDAMNCRVSRRGYGMPSGQGGSLGLRLALSK